MSEENTTLPIGWKLTPFNQLATYATGRTPARAIADFWAAPTAEGIPWISIADMRPYDTLKTTSEKISPRAMREVFRNRISKKGTLIMSFKLTIGRVATLGLDACHNEAIISIFPNERTNQKYLEYFLSQVDYADYQDRAVKGNTLNKEKIDRIAIAEPPKHEQEKIAAVLWRVQRAMEVEQKLVSTTRDLKRTTMSRLFAHGLGGEQQKETEFGFVPKSWVVVQLGDLFNIKHGYAFKGEFFSTVGKYILLTPGHFYEEGGFRDQKNKTKFYTGQFPPEYLLEKGDMLVAMTEQTSGLLGSAIVVPESAKYLHNQRLGLVTNLNETRLNKSFLYYYLARPDIRAKIEQTATGSKVRHTSPGRICDLPIALPGPDEQKEIVTILQTIDRKISVHEHKRATLSDLFQTLLNQLMTAQIRVDKLDIDTSEVTA